MSPPPDVVLLSRSCPPDVGGYQRQLSLVLPRLVARGVRARGVSARRTTAAGPPGWPDVPTLVLPVAGLPRLLRGLSDPVLAVLALAVGAAARIRTRRPPTLLLVSPAMRGARPVAVAWARFLGPVVARYPGSGGLRRARLASVPGVRHVVLSPDQRAEATALGASASLVENAVELPPAPAPDRTFHRFVVVGRLIPTKRVDLVLEAWRLAAPRLPAWRLEVIGSGQGGSDDVEAELRMAAADLPRVTFTGEVPDARSRLGGDAVVVHCSTLEGVPNTLLEALAAGAPVVADPAALARWFDDPPPHVAWDGDSAASLAAVLERAAGDLAALRRVGAAGREAARARWSPEAVVDRWLEVLR